MVSLPAIQRETVETVGFGAGSVFTGLKLRVNERITSSKDHRQFVKELDPLVVESQRLICEALRKLRGQVCNESETPGVNL